MAELRNIVVLTGAGISAESGIDTFRDAGGLWEKHRVEDVATPQGYERDPALAQRGPTRSTPTHGRKTSGITNEPSACW